MARPAPQYMRRLVEWADAKLLDQDAARLGFTVRNSDTLSLTYYGMLYCSLVEARSA